MADNEKYPLALREGTILAGQYTIQGVLGQGGFGITYVATDHTSGQKVAVKEFFPDTLAYREATNVISYPGERTENFDYGKESFLQEAKTLAAFIGCDNIARIYSYFEENGTAYFVMEYIDGKSFDVYIKERGGKITCTEAKGVLVPIMDALAVVHSKGIVHRDVTPDNIFITKDGRVKLLDFGAARYSLGDKSRSLDVILKHGFAPKEQYTRRGKQGPYTDVYSLGATFYFAITGRRPPDSIDRLEEDELIPPSRLGVQITQYEEEAILQALSVQPSDRFQSMTAFKSVFMNEPVAAPDPSRMTQQVFSAPPAATSDPNNANTAYAPTAYQQSGVPTPVPTPTAPPSPVPPTTAQNPAQYPGQSAQYQQTGVPVSANQPPQNYGYTQYPQNTPQETPIKKKSKAPLFIALGAVAAVGIAAALIIPNVLKGDDDIVDDNKNKSKPTSSAVAGEESVPDTSSKPSGGKTTTTTTTANTPDPPAVVDLATGNTTPGGNDFSNTIGGLVDATSGKLCYFDNERSELRYDGETVYTVSSGTMIEGLCYDKFSDDLYFVERNKHFARYNHTTKKVEYIDELDSLVEKNSEGLNYIYVTKDYFFIFKGNPDANSGSKLYRVNRYTYAVEDSMTIFGTNASFTICDNKIFVIGQTKDGLSSLYAVSALNFNNTVVSDIWFTANTTVYDSVCSDGSYVYALCTDQVNGLQFLVRYDNKLDINNRILYYFEEITDNDADYWISLPIVCGNQILFTFNNYNTNNCLVAHGTLTGTGDDAEVTDIKYVTVSMNHSWYKGFTKIGSNYWMFNIGDNGKVKYSTFDSDGKITS